MRKTAEELSKDPWGMPDAATYLRSLAESGTGLVQRPPVIDWVFGATPRTLRKAPDTIFAEDLAYVKRSAAPVT